MLRDKQVAFGIIATLYADKNYWRMAKAKANEEALKQELKVSDSLVGICMCNLVSQTLGINVAWVLEYLEERYGWQWYCYVPEGV